MKHYITHIDKSGRILIPSVLRKDFSNGETFIIQKVSDEEINIVSKRKIVKEIQNWAKNNIELKDSIVDDFLLNRKEDDKDL